MSLPALKSQSLHPVLDRIGNTPLIDLTEYARQERLEGVRIYAKAEWHNPGGSVKDRPAYNMVKRALEDGRLQPGKILIDSTSGNTGIAYAMIGRFLDYPVQIVAPENMDAARVNVLKSYRANLIFSSPFEGSDGSIRLCRKLVAADPDLYFWPDQYNNPDNPRAHYETTAPEIHQDLGNRLTHFVTSIGTSGSLMGTGSRLRQLNPNVKIYAAEPDDGFHGIEGLKHMPSSIIPGIYDPSWLDGIESVTTDEALDLTDRLNVDGFPVGSSSGCSLAACLKIAQRLPKRVCSEATFITLFADTHAKSAIDENQPFKPNGELNRVEVEE